MTEAEHPDHVVILVHGTWARGAIPVVRKRAAAWCLERSACRRAVAEALGDDVKFEIFNWSGRNSLHERLAAAEQLGRKVLELRARHDGAALHVIAHSHGGNVVFYAMRNKEVRRELRSVACLSTPFLHVERRRIGRRVGALLTFGAVALPWIIALPFWMMPFMFFENDIAGFLGTTACLSALTWSIAKLARIMPIWSFEHAATLRYPRSRNVECPVLILRGPADEAGGALAAAQLLSSFVTACLSFISKLVPEWWLLKASSTSPVHAAIDRAFERAASLGLLLAVSAVALGALLPSSESPYPHPLALWTFGIGAAVILLSQVGAMIAFATMLGVFVAISAAAVLLCLLAALLAAPFGFGFVLTGVGLHVSGESTPPGTWNLHQLGPKRGQKAHALQLQHSTHSDWRALAALSSWLRQNAIGNAMTSVGGCRSAVEPGSSTTV